MKKQEDIVITVIPIYQVIYARNEKSLKWDTTLSGRDIMEAGEEDERYKLSTRKLFEATCSEIPSGLSSKIDAFIENASLIGEFDSDKFQSLINQYPSTKRKK